MAEAHGQSTKRSTAVRRRMGAYVVLGWAFLLTEGMLCQAPQVGLERALAQIGATADMLDRALPSFTCLETGTSEVRQGKKVRQHVSFSATLQARRTDGGSHDETYTLTELNGAPYSGHYIFPFYVSGGFDKGMRYFAPSLQGCYRYTILPGRINFASAPDAGTHPGCRDEGIRGFALLDADGNVTHLERRVSEEAVDSFRLSPFTAIDFAPVELNGETFRLSQHMVSEYMYEGTRSRFEVTYTECRLFHVTVTLGDGDGSGKDSPPVGRPH